MVEQTKPKNSHKKTQQKRINMLKINRFKPSRLDPQLKYKHRQTQQIKNILKQCYHSHKSRRIPSCIPHLRNNKKKWNNNDNGPLKRQHKSNPP